ncbi:hypothetical protein HPP92_022073 [Vanilla planifolia]|uniref:Sphingomyelin phosphodiesterase 4 n=1 Tax=Vanilla planifolia TaxID=51239 RepID=A0A835PRJ5_VANPL|nr:hypothetical protein HPP92_022073 [Vanilla planifolia]
MMPRSYSLDAHARAQDLASSVLSASSPPAIASAISNIDSVLRKLSTDQSRAFFSVAFPAMICRLFGFDDSAPPKARSPAALPAPSTAWIDQAHKDPELADRLFVLLCPNGLLMSALLSADRHGLVNYLFPAERLPEWIRFALQSDRHSSILADLCPLFRGRVKEDPVLGACQLQLNAFEYYMFWFAYYPVCRGNCEGSDDCSVQKSRRKSRLENWTSSLPVLVNPGRRSGQKKEVSLYLRLLYAYLSNFVPKHSLGSHQPYGSSLLHYSSSYDISSFEQTEFLVYTFIHFWLVGNDFSPLDLTVSQSFGITFPHRALLGATIPTPGLGEVVNLFVKYLNSCLVATTEGSDQKGLIDSGSRKPILSFENSWSSAIQRPLYRFLLRTFIFFPIGASFKNVAQVFSVWVMYLAPWRISLGDFFQFEEPAKQKSESLKKENIKFQGKSTEENKRDHPEAVYTHLWESYVVSNYLFYSSLFVHFLGFAHKFLHANVEVVVDMVLKVLSILISSQELIDLLRKVDTTYHAKQSRLYSPLTYVHKYVPSIRQQLKDWEDCLCESDIDGFFLHENWNQDLKLFDDGEDGAHKLLQLFVLRAEHEIQSMPIANTHSLHALQSIKSHMNHLFGGGIIPLPHSQTSTSQPDMNGRGEVFKPKHPGFGERTWDDIRYKGEWMRRPISDTEVAWLARLLVRLSDWLNEVLGLDRVGTSEPSGLTYVELPCADSGFVGGAKEAAVMLITLIVAWLGMFGHSVTSFMRGRGMRINLRIFASKKLVLVLVMYATVYALRKACCKTASTSLASGMEHSRYCS